MDRVQAISISIDRVARKHRFSPHRGNAACEGTRLTAANAADVARYRHSRRSQSRPSGTQAPQTGPSDSNCTRRAHYTASANNHLSAAIGKTGARNRTEACRIAREQGWL
jgi:hypothetical protein